MSNFEFDLLSWIIIFFLLIMILINFYLIIQYNYINPSILDTSSLLQTKFKK